jgi:hypothetical protein
MAFSCQGGRQVVRYKQTGASVNGYHNNAIVSHDIGAVYYI